ncbi:unnamed protein product (macronuclear) [Paramecium tetraurelia]|uniref:MSP domain-containing protein n=1 Tax=Paramecium tetraurelia TaxID=5888 RepID=A0E6Z6_PARTE|nr:uncharacterized protein GSPATT00023791001 [Paramecium tetraurelia]CAK91063.1 unnamed protein product [Paramecium tetraurelia]|eukprot:XP_001458460.1 hypothetical protein (macronuclear) [Paramecium tetraurelia strain d4-2]
MIEVSHKSLQFQEGQLNQLKFKITNVSDVPITFRIRCNNNTNYKLDHYMGLIHSHQDFENNIQNFEAADLKLPGDQLEIQYAEFLDPLQDLKDFWKSTQSQDHVMIPIEVLDIQQQQKEAILAELKVKQQTLQQELQSIKQEYVQSQKPAVEINHFNKLYNGFTIGKLIIVIAISLLLGSICR